MKSISVKLLVAALAIAGLSACSKDKKEDPPAAEVTELEKEGPQIIPAGDPSVIDAAATEPTVTPEPQVDETKFPAELLAFDKKLPDQLAKIPRDKTQLCLVDSLYSESLFGLSTDISIYCNLERTIGGFVHEFGLRRSTELHMMSFYVLKKRFLEAGFTVVECDETPALSESGLQISGQAKCSFSRTGSQPAI